MSYEDTLEAAGATVHDVEYTGLYQGEWFAFVTFNGVTGIVSGSYGSCSYCDSLQGMYDEEKKDPDWMAKFGAGYLEDIESIESFIMRHQKAAETDRYDAGDAKQLLKWIEKAIAKINASTTLAIAPFRATFQFDFGLTYDSAKGEVTEPGHNLVLDKAREEIDEIGVGNWLEKTFFGVRRNG